jgi:hypothetical protein
MRFGFVKFIGLIWMVFSAQAQATALSTYRCHDQAEPGLWIQFTVVAPGSESPTLLRIRTYRQSIDGRIFDEIQYSKIDEFEFPGQILARSNAVGLQVLLVRESSSIRWEVLKGQYTLKTPQETGGDITCVFIGFGQE